MGSGLLGNCMDNDEPIFYDGKFRQKRKHGVWREVEAPVLEVPV